MPSYNKASSRASSSLLALSWSTSCVVRCFPSSLPGINPPPTRSGWYDPLIQNQAYVDFATNAPGYGQLQSDAVLAKLNQSYFGPGGCRDQELACYAAGTGAQSNKICKKADDFCVGLLYFFSHVTMSLTLHKIPGHQRLCARGRGPWFWRPEAELLGALSSRVLCGLLAHSSNKKENRGRNQVPGVPGCTI